MIWDLEVEIVVARAEVIHMKAQFAATQIMRNQAFGLAMVLECNFWNHSWLRIFGLMSGLSNCKIWSWSHLSTIKLHRFNINVRCIPCIWVLNFNFKLYNFVLLWIYYAQCIRNWCYTSVIVNLLIIWSLGKALWIHCSLIKLRLNMNLVVGFVGINCQ